MSVILRHICDFFEQWAPPSSSMDYDNVGLLFGDNDSTVSKILVCLDVTEEVVEEAIHEKVDLIVAHHPLIFKGLKSILPNTSIGRIIIKLIQHQIGVYAFHTNFDAAADGVSKVLADQLGLSQTKFLEDSKDGEYGFGMIGELESPLTANDFLCHVGEKLKLSDLRFSGNTNQIKKVAVCGGTGSFLLRSAIQKDADALITADIKYHEYFVDSNMLLVDVGHYESEIGAMSLVKQRLLENFPMVEVCETRVNTNPMRYFNFEKTTT